MNILDVGCAHREPFQYSHELGGPGDEGAVAEMVGGGQACEVQ